jgi:hypothetical protein
MKSSLVLSIFALILFQANRTKGEYRAFLLEINSPGAEQPRLVESSLDPLQYRYYYPLRPEETVSYTKTWRCPGRTSNLPVCKNPKDTAPGEEPDQAPLASSSKSPERTPASQ